MCVGGLFFIFSVQVDGLPRFAGGCAREVEEGVCSLADGYQVHHERCHRVQVRQDVLGERRDEQ